MNTIGVRKVVAHYQDMFVDYCELRAFTEAFELGIKQGFLAETLMGFIQGRERRMRDIMQKEAESVSLRAAACQDLGLSEFTLDNFRTNMPENILDALSEVTNDTQKVIEDIQEIDTRLNQTLQMELEATKLDLQRFQSINRVRRAYQSANEPEARFIDKNK